MTGTKTHDDEHAFRGYWDAEPEARCRVRIVERDGSPPILLITESPTNESTSITTVMEYLAAELIARHFPHRFEVVDEPPAVVVEHYLPIPGVRGVRERPTYDLVTFEDWRPRRVWLGGLQRLSLGEPDWRHMPPAEVRALLGAEADDLPPGEARP
jgi:hypothetical protein